MNEAIDWLRSRLPELVAEHGVGAQVAVFADGELADAAAGVLSTATGEPVTTGSLFQIGSITKVWTATLVAQLVEEGLLDLDRPVREVLPGFRLADEQVARVVTPRQLLCHLGGFEGDQWFDTGTGDDCVEKFVARLADARQLTEPGELFSYCNAGYVVLGRIVEVVRGKPFHVVLRERLVAPLGLTNVATHYDEYPEHQVAEGHLPVGGTQRPVDRMMPGSDAPAGSAFAMNARSLVSFARMHLETTTYDSMRVEQVKTPDGGGWGLGWTVHNYPDGTVGIGHGGATMGQDAALRVLPDAGVAIAVLTNGGAAGKLQYAVSSHLLAELAGVRLAELPVPPTSAIPVDADRVTGVYRSSAVNIHVTPAPPGRVRVRYEPRNWIAEATMADEGTEYTALDHDALIAVDEPHTVLRLVRRGDQVRWVHFGRAAVRR
ncbi:serine hydrolase domain-containing protein [Lentzea flaviverrucosa]|uniref:CubicO group peptidase, beta-lactamase class C family n=1 Tax=Lentzea flaviverrucosa TaxID=200379 RepID=A0A1H9XPM8_9PSEU|nr:serine hydrolase domain-containing protein [Lentzea flaviverrucosa]RDI19737.1 CubicO group peptidase (beta-lactamase class C family) [Lentzea flaviverrucosa]SES48106.1 CubicO group peptidase, beta-lactamase class C family [Lentzea flaviverrucosa]